MIVAPTFQIGRCGRAFWAIAEHDQLLGAGCGPTIPGACAHALGGLHLDLERCKAGQAPLHMSDGPGRVYAHKLLGVILVAVVGDRAVAHTAESLEIARQRVAAALALPDGLAGAARQIAEEVGLGEVASFTIDAERLIVAGPVPSEFLLAAWSPEALRGALESFVALRRGCRRG